MKLDKKTLEYAEKYLVYKNDPVLFAEEIILIPAIGGDERIVLYEPQKRVLRSFFKDHHLILLKSRQTGFSTLTRILMAYIATFFDNCSMGIMSKTGGAASDFCRKVEDMIDKIPVWLRPEYKHKSVQSFSLKNGTSLNSTAVSPANPGAVFRGLSLNFLCLDESAHISKVSEAWLGVAPALSKAQMDAEKKGIPFGTIILSTPNKQVGIGKWFFNRWQAAQGDGEPFIPHKIHWSEIPDFKNDPKWYKKQCQILENDPRKIAQELELKFVGSENTLFDTSIQEKLQTLRNPPLERISLSHRLEIQRYGAVSKDRFYLIGVDSASEAGGTDFSTIEVFDFETMDQILEFHGKLAVKKFAKIVMLVAKMCPRNILIVEKTGGYGNQVIEEIEADTEYQYNLYGEPKSKKDPTILPGLSTNSHSRPLILDALYHFVNGSPESIKSEMLSLELIGLADKVNRIEADTGGHDDLCFALAFCCYIRHYKKDVLDNTDPTDTESTMFTDDSLALISDLNAPLHPLKHEFGTRSYGQFKRTLHDHIKDNLGQGVSGNVNVFDLFKDDSDIFNII